MTGRTDGIDFVLPDAPPLRQPPLSLLQLAVPLIRTDDVVASQQDAQEKLASAQARVAEALKRLGDAPAEEKMAAQLVAEEAQTALQAQQAWASDETERLADLQRWEAGFVYLPELSNTEAMEIFVPGSGGTKRTDATQTPVAWYDPFEVVAHDDRSLFGFPHSNFEERAARTMRALLAHEPWQVEHEFWTGQKVPTNYHLTASPATPTTGVDRTIPAFPNPTAAPDTTLGTAVGLKKALAALVQAIANASAGAGMIHATPYVVQLWASNNPFIRDAAGRIYTSNMNLIVPGYGYPGSGPDNTRTVADAATNTNTSLISATAAFSAMDVGASVSGAGIAAGTTIVSVTNATTVVLSAATSATAAGVTVVITPNLDRTAKDAQWAYATDMVYSLQGAARTLPWDLGQATPEASQQNSVEVRAERTHAVITNRLLRAAVLVDTTTA